MKKKYSVVHNSFDNGKVARSEVLDGEFGVYESAMAYVKGLVEIARANTQRWLDHDFKIESEYDDTVVRVVAEVVVLHMGYGVKVGKGMVVSFEVRENA